MGAVALACVLQLGCAGCSWNVGPVDYTPFADGDWSVSTPGEQGIDPRIIDEFYVDASRVETIRALLVIKNGELIAEAYFNDGSIGLETNLQSVTKSFVGTLTGIAIDEGILPGLDQKMADYFPELTPFSDSRKAEITIEQLLQMRAGFPWEEATAEGSAWLYHGFRPSDLRSVPLVRDPGTGFDYSNFSSHLLGIILARAAGTDLKSYAEENLFDPLGITAGEWIPDWEGNYSGHAGLHITARDMAKLGLLYMNGGVWEGEQIVPEHFIRAALTMYSHDAWYTCIGRNVKEMAYGYQWWSARAGERRYTFAWGHGGQQVALLPEQQLIVVVAADPFYGESSAEQWRREKENLNLVGDFIAGLPVD
jgi:CubicO group peptidase (beta-lactamase class C family)